MPATPKSPKAVIRGAQVQHETASVQAKEIRLSPCDSKRFLKDIDHPPQPTQELMTFVIGSTRSGSGFGATVSEGQPERRMQE